MLPTFERRNHGSGVWFPDEIMDALSAVDLANWDISRQIDTPEVRMYRRGYEAAIAAIATTFGLAYYPRSTYAPTISEVPDHASSPQLNAATKTSRLSPPGER